MLKGKIIDSLAQETRGYLIRKVKPTSKEKLSNFLFAHAMSEWLRARRLDSCWQESLVADYQQNKPLELNQKFADGLRNTLTDSSLKKEFISSSITLPGEGEVMDLMDIADTDAVLAVRTFIWKQLASQLKNELLSKVKENRSSEAYEFNHPNMARSALKNTALAYLACLNEPEFTELALQEYRAANIILFFCLPQD